MQFHTLSLLLIFLSRQFFLHLTNESYKKTSSKFEIIADWILSNCENIPNISTITKKFDITTSYLNHLFNSYYHCSTMKFLHDAKISKAKDMLLTTNLLVKEISFYLNFNSEKYFMRLFKEETGYTPTEYRNLFFLRNHHI
ncbi:MAG: helix-turn-helix domain-containing protein [Enterococcus sp.]